MVIRVGLGVNDDIKLSKILTFMQQNSFGPNKLIEVFNEYTVIYEDIQNINELREDPEFDNKSFYEKVVYWLTMITEYLRYIGNTFVLIVSFLYMTLSELIYLLRIVVYLIFGISYGM